MTRIEHAAEYAYRRDERISLLAAGGKPTLSQCYLAETEATAACDEIDRLDKLEKTNQGELL
jgi:hypothetical protein